MNRSALRCAGLLRSVVLVLLPGVLAVGSLCAQQVRGTLRRAIDSLPVAGALVLISDGAGHEVARMASNEQGTFVSPLPRGSATLRVLRIGYRPWVMANVTAPESGRLNLDLYLPELPVVLPQLTFAARSCGIPNDSGVIGLLLAEAHTAIALTQATLDARELVFQVETWHRHQAPQLFTIDSVGMVTHDRSWPIRSAPAESLRIKGFVQDGVDAGGYPVTVYYGPDARVLFDEWFQRSHCLRLLPRGRTHGLLTVEFTPASRGRNPDIAGQFVFDSTTLALQELRFHWTGLESWIPTEGPGGFVRFVRTPSGAWLPEAWSLRAPIAKAVSTGLVIDRYLEVGGRSVINPP